MKPETLTLIQETEKKLFESDELATTRNLIGWTPQNSGTEEDVDILSERIDEFPPSMENGFSLLTSNKSW